MIRLAYNSPAKLAYAIRSESGVWNKTTSAWEALPADGVLTANHLLPLAKTASTGPLANEQTAIVPAAVIDSVPASWVVVFKVKPDGTLAGDPTDLQDVDGLPSSGDVYVQIKGVAVRG